MEISIYIIFCLLMVWPTLKTISYILEQKAKENLQNYLYQHLQTVFAYGITYNKNKGVL